MGHGVADRSLDRAGRSEIQRPGRERHQARRQGLDRADECSNRQRDHHQGGADRAQGGQERHAHRVFETDARAGAAHLASGAHQSKRSGGLAGGLEPRITKNPGRIHATRARRSAAWWDQLRRGLVAARGISMNTTSSAERSLRDGDPGAALKQLQEQVRARPADTKLRIFLFQLLAVLGQWERAGNQLDVAAGLDPSALAMKQTYHEAILCELLRAQVFAGKKSPLVLGQPEPWLGLLIESVLQSGRGEEDAAAKLRAEAFEQAPESAGTLDGNAFAWIA